LGPLVSVVIITYNSGDKIERTLESVRNQTYDNIEIIVSDDCSTDNTINIVNGWLNRNKDRFARVIIEESRQNTGITPNLNRGLKKARGVYIKPLSGDDELVPECIERLVSYVIENKLDFCYADVILQRGGKEYSGLVEDIYFSYKMHKFFQLTQVSQYKSLLLGFPMYTIGLFLATKFIVQLGYFDEKYPMMEDYPFALLASSLGYRLNLLDEKLVVYNCDHITNDRQFKSTKRFKRHFIDYRRFTRDRIIPELLCKGMLDEALYIILRETRLLLSIHIKNQIVAHMFGVIEFLSLTKYKMKLDYIRFRHNYAGPNG